MLWFVAEVWEPHYSFQGMGLIGGGSVSACTLRSLSYGNTLSLWYFFVGTEQYISPICFMLNLK